jgi:hypothetical protein
MINIASNWAYGYSGHSVVLLRERLGTEFSNCSVPDRSLDRLPLSPPDVFPIDIHSSDIFLFPNPRLDRMPEFVPQGYSTWWRTTSNIIKFHSFLRLFFFSLGRNLWTNDHMVKYYSRVTFPVMLDMAPYAFLAKKIVTLINWLPECLIRQSRERINSLYDVPQNIRPTDSIEWHWRRGYWGVGSTPRQLPGNRMILTTATILFCVTPNSINSSANSLLIKYHFSHYRNHHQSIH